MKAISIKKTMVCSRGYQEDDVVSVGPNSAKEETKPKRDLEEIKWK
jgi:uncharacterized protein YdaT